MKRRILPILLSAAIVFAAPMTTFAAETDNSATAQAMTPEQAAAKEHTYKAYQIFTGDYIGSKFVEVNWGTDANDTVKAALASIITPVDENGTAIVDPKAKDFAKAISDANATYFTTNKEGVGADIIANAIDTAIKTSTPAGYSVVKDTNGQYSIQNGAIGWYLIVDTTEGLTDEYAVYVDRSQLQMYTSGALQINAKHTTITVEKKVKDINDSISVDYDEWDKSADYDIDDWIPFQITGTVPDNYDIYETFEYTFEDKQSDGLIFDAKSVKVYINSTKEDITNAFDTTAAADGHSFTVSCADLKTKVPSVQAGDKIVLEYKSQLTGSGVEYGYDGNPNHARIKFSNDVVGEGYTPWDIAIVFTFIPEVDKVNSKLEPLTGAEFTISKLVKGEDGKEAEWATVKRADGTDYAYKMTVDTAGTHFSFKGIDDGIYRVTESVVPDGFNKADDIYFVVEAEHDVKNKLTKLVIKDLAGKVIGTSDDSDTTNLGTFTVSKDAGTATTTVINQEGVVLPSTGGIGTTIFYIVGGVLVVGAVVLLIVRRRMRTEEE